jgi:hypothetical protein
MPGLSRPVFAESGNIRYFCRYSNHAIVAYGNNTTVLQSCAMLPRLIICFLATRNYSRLNFPLFVVRACILIVDSRNPKRHPKTEDGPTLRSFLATHELPLLHSKLFLRIFFPGAPEIGIMTHECFNMAYVQNVHCVQAAQTHPRPHCHLRANSSRSVNVDFSHVANPRTFGPLSKVKFWFLVLFWFLPRRRNFFSKGMVGWNDTLLEL